MAENLLNIYKEAQINRDNIDEISSVDGVGIGDPIDDISLKIDDEEILNTIKVWRNISSDLHNTMIQIGEKNYRYYIGNFADYPYRDYLKTINNRIFTSIETIVPIATSRPAQPVVYPGTNTDKSKELSGMHQKILLSLFKNLNLQQKTEALIRHNQFYRLGVIKYGIKDGKIITDYVLPTRLWIDPNATCADDCEFIGEAIRITAKDLIEYFPKKEKEILDVAQGHKLRKLEIMERWTQDMLIITLNDKYVLRKVKNPHFSYKDSKNETSEFGDYIDEDYRYNYFDKPKVPYIFLQVNNTGLGVIDDVTALEQCIPIQDAIVNLTYQVLDNAAIVGNPILKASGFTNEQVDDLMLRKPGDAVNIPLDKELGYLEAPQLPNYLLLMIDKLQEKIDDIFGTHPTTRGNREGQETLGGRELLRQGDEDRQSTLGRGIERVLNELYRAWTHLIKVHYDEKQLMPDLTLKGAQEYLTVSRDNIEDGIEIYVVAGSTLPDDKVAKRQEALELWGQQAISIEKLYEALGWDNPTEESIAFKLDQLETQLVNSNAQQIIAAYGEEGKMLTPKMLAQIILSGGIGDIEDKEGDTDIGEGEVNTQNTGLGGQESNVGMSAVANK